jgi:uncharacterized small protein (DUF1192 family)
MTTNPTPEELQKFKDFFVDYVKRNLSESQDRTEDEIIGVIKLEESLQMFEAYHQHRLIEVEPFSPSADNAELRRKVAALQEMVKKLQEEEKDTPMISTLKKHLKTVSREEFEKDWAEVKSMNLQGPTVSEMTKDMFIYSVEQLQQQLAAANAEIDRLKFNGSKEFDCPKCGKSDSFQVVQRHIRCKTCANEYSQDV